MLCYCVVTLVTMSRCHKGCGYVIGVTKCDKEIKEIKEFRVFKEIEEIEEIEDCPF